MHCVCCFTPSTFTLQTISCNSINSLRSNSFKDFCDINLFKTISCNSVNSPYSNSFNSLCDLNLFKTSDWDWINYSNYFSSWNYCNWLFGLFWIYSKQSIAIVSTAPRVIVSIVYMWCQSIQNNQLQFCQQPPEQSNYWNTTSRVLLIRHAHSGYTSLLGNEKSYRRSNGVRTTGGKKLKLGLRAVYLQLYFY